MVSRTSDSLSLFESAVRVKSAAKTIALATSAQKDEALWSMAELIRGNAHEILLENEKDVSSALGSGQTNTSIDRLVLNEARIQSMADQIELVARLSDPVGEVVSGQVLPNGLVVRKERVPLGVVGIIYENRPNVTSDSAALCIKSGNAAFLRGSSSAIRTNTAIAILISEALEKARLPGDAVSLVRDTSRKSAVEFMQLEGYIDCLIPRGGPSLIETVCNNARIPYIIDGDGNCHIYVDESADLDKSLAIIANSKVQRPGVCNAVETLLIHRNIADELLARLEKVVPTVEIRGDKTVCAIIGRAKEVSDLDFATEFLDLILAVKVVSDLDEALEHISKYGTGHSEAILTNSYENARRFTKEVDAAAVLVNASTRFVDGNQLGLGAEIGISTQKLHARGPMGLTSLTCERYVIQGQGQVRL